MSAPSQPEPKTEAKTEAKDVPKTEPKKEVYLDVDLEDLMDATFVGNKVHLERKSHHLNLPSCDIFGDKNYMRIMWKYMLWMNGLFDMYENEKTRVMAVFAMHETYCKIESGSKFHNNKQSKSIMKNLQDCINSKTPRAEFDKYILSGEFRKCLYDSNAYYLIMCIFQ